MIEQRTVPGPDPDEDDWLDARPGRPPVLGAGLALPEVPGEPVATLTQAEPGPADVVRQPVAPGPAQVHWEEMPETLLPERPFPGAVASAGDPVPARWGWRNRVRQVSAGLIQPSPGAEEKAFRDEVDTVRRSTWTRSVNVVVTNPKGGSGKTPAALVLAGVLGSLRGGYVVAWEATESAGTLARRCEGGTGRGLAEMLAGIPGITSAGRLGGYTAPQTSNADVIASAAPRDMLSAPQMLSVREVLDTYYRITVTDTGNNPGHETYRAAMRTADAVLIPCLVSVDALEGVEQTLRLIESTSGPVDLRERVVVVLGHDGGPEDPGTAETVRRRLGELRTAAVIEVPFDPLVRRGGEISLSALSEESRRAWTRAAAAVVRALSAANSDIDLVAQTRAEMG